MDTFISDLMKKMAPHRIIQLYYSQEEADRLGYNEFHGIKVSEVTTLGEKPAGNFRDMKKVGRATNEQYAKAMIVHPTPRKEAMLNLLKKY